MWKLGWSGGEGGRGALGVDWQCFEEIGGRIGFGLVELTDKILDSVVLLLQFVVVENVYVWCGMSRRVAWFYGRIVM